MRCLRSLLALSFSAGVCSVASAQFNDQWVTFTQQPTMLAGNPTGISNGNTEIDFAWGDLNKDGWIDLVVVRKEPFTSPGKRTNILLMNENGVLRDRSTLYASAADVAGDNGFNTATNDRDVFIEDFDQDGWDDFVTATTISDSDPKHIGHPRVYMNLKNAGGNWQGMRFENARIPQLLHFSSGQPKNPRFCSVAAGDVTGDDYPDLFFGDYDSSGAGGSGEPGSNDLNDRLLINDGNGFFSDQSQSRMTSDMLQSAFAAAAVIADMNGDGANDVLKQTALTPPQDIRVIYNRTGVNEGSFNINDKFHLGFTPYHVNAGDLNNDGRLDMITSEDNADLFRINQGNDGLGRVNWSSAHGYNYLTGGDDGFGSNNLVADLDLDGWNDTLHCDVDVDIGGCNRRLHIYHNRGGAVGGTPLLREERQSTSSSGWIGVVGPSDNDLEGMHDVAVFDVDNDGDPDMVFGRCSGTFVWRSELNPGCPAPTKFGTPEASCVTGNPAVTSFSGGQSAGQGYTISVSGGTPNQFAVLFLGESIGLNTGPWGTIIPGAPGFLRVYTSTNGSGDAQVNDLVQPSMVGKTVWFQFAVRDPSCGGTNTVQAGDAVGVQFCP